MWRALWGTALRLLSAARGKERLLRKITAVECPIVSQKNLAGWCVQRARALGKPMDSNAAALLADMVGTNLGQMDGQVRFQSFDGAPCGVPVRHALR